MLKSYQIKSICFAQTERPRHVDRFFQTAADLYHFDSHMLHRIGSEKCRQRKQALPAVPGRSLGSGGFPVWQKAEMGNFCKAENGNLRFFKAEIGIQT